MFYIVYISYYFWQILNQVGKKSFEILAHDKPRINFNSWLRFTKYSRSNLHVSFKVPSSTTSIFSNIYVSEQMERYLNTDAVPQLIKWNWWYSSWRPESYFTWSLCQTSYSWNITCTTESFWLKFSISCELIWDERFRIRFLSYLI